MALKQIFHSQKPIPLAEMHIRANSGDPPHPPTAPCRRLKKRKIPTHLFGAQIPKMLAADLYTRVYVGSETKTDAAGEKEGMVKRTREEAESDFHSSSSSSSHRRLPHEDAGN